MSDNQLIAMISDPNLQTLPSQSIADFALISAKLLCSAPDSLVHQTATSFLKRNQNLVKLLGFKDVHELLNLESKFSKMGTSPLRAGFTLLRAVVCKDDQVLLNALIEASRDILARIPMEMLEDINRMHGSDILPVSAKNGVFVENRCGKSADMVSSKGFKGQVGNTPGTIWVEARDQFVGLLRDWKLIEVLPKLNTDRKRRVEYKVGDVLVVCDCPLNFDPQKERLDDVDQLSMLAERKCKAYSLA